MFATADSPRDRETQELINPSLIVTFDSPPCEFHCIPKRWSKLYDRCVICGGTDRKHKGHGRCTRCHDCANYRKNPDQWRMRAKKWADDHKERVHASVAKWQAENPDKVKRYKTDSQQARRAGERTVERGVPPLIFRGMSVHLKSMGWQMIVDGRPRMLDGEWVIDAKHHGRLYKDIPVASLEVKS